MARARSDVDEQIADLLRTARTSLGLPVAFLSRLDGTTQTLEVVESAIPVLVREGATRPQATSLCQAALDGRIPAVLPDLARDPVAMALPAARLPRFRSYITVPVRLSDGRLYGTFCAAGLRSDPSLGSREHSLVQVLARAAALVLEPVVREREAEAEIRGRLDPLIAAGGPVVVLQPIVRLADGVRVGAEALSRFPAEWGMPPDVCFAQAHRVGEGARLELQALERAARHLDAVQGYVSLNVSPAVLLDPACAALLRLLPMDRVLLELSEHDPVEDYSALSATLDPLRAAGLRLAIDDVGAGFSSLRHIVLTAPDVIKLDRSVVAGVAGDAVLRRLIDSMVSFAHGGDARVVAEGVETQDDAVALLELGVDDGQGWLFGRPGPPEALGTVPASAGATLAG